MQERKIPKRSGGYRTIVAPDRDRKRACRRLLPQLHAWVRRMCDPDVVHGFAERRNVVTAACRHVGYRYTVSMDLSDAFDHVTRGNTNFTGGTADCFWHKGRAAQGLPTSPLLCNLALADADSRLKPLAGTGGVYTRYGDDLSWSTDSWVAVEGILRSAPEILAKAGFPINPRKTRVQHASIGRRMILGLGVDDNVHPSRRSKRKLRAARHNARRGRRPKVWPIRQWARAKRLAHRDGLTISKRALLRRWLWQRVRGLEEWVKCKVPSSGHKTASRIGETMPPAKALTELSKRW